jgi:transposase-like protein
MKKDNYSHREKMLALVEQQQVAGKPLGLFCSGHGISTSVFYYWQKKYRESHLVSSPSFLPVETLRSSQGFSAIEIVYPNGVLLRLEQATVEELESLLSLRLK